MIIRVYALYHKNKYILGLLLTLWTGQLILSAIGLSTGHRKLFLIHQQSAATDKQGYSDPTSTWSRRLYPYRNAQAVPYVGLHVCHEGDFC
jgi:hypothetical protein